MTIQRTLRDLFLLWLSAFLLFFFAVVVGFQRAAEFCPHHLGHYLGMDTHDTNMVSRGLGFHPGMLITVEPGIYISEHNDKVPERLGSSLHLISYPDLTLSLEM